MKQIFQMNVIRDNGAYEPITVEAIDKDGEPAICVAIKHLLAKNTGVTPGIKSIQQVQLVATVHLDATV